MDTTRDLVLKLAEQEGKALPDRSRTQQIRGSLKPAPGHISEKNGRYSDGIDSVLLRS